MQQQQVGPGRVVGMFVIGAFCLGLLIYTAMGNLALLTHVYPDPQFVGFGLLSLDGGVVAWTILAFLTRKDTAHFGIVLLGLAVDSLLSCTGFMYELSARTGEGLPVQLPVIYVIGFAVVFNIGAALVYKLLPMLGTGNRNLIPGGQVKFEQTGYMPAYGGGETDSPLSFNRTGTAQLPVRTGGKAKRAASSTTQADTEDMKTGTTAGRVPGNRKRTTFASTSFPTDYQSDPDTDEDELEIIPIDELR